MANETILVIEDNEIQREGMAFILRNAGYTIVTAKGGDEGLSLMRSGPKPNLILLDMLMPNGGDGWDFLQRRRHQPELVTVPVIITTGVGYASDEWAAALGACSLIRKPIDTDVLLSLIRKCL
jgi:CheY-like chemotaxis protein